MSVALQIRLREGIRAILVQAASFLSSRHGRETPAGANVREQGIVGLLLISVVDLISATRRATTSQLMVQR